ncbi:glycosyltransferase [Ancylothrix sp. C2]|uniref:glycosyltransferase family 2 protein n=1 Tax=Ancylothrix sp. D3o TaxID=2953691 RepID=UPI0021BA8EB1|nr:glycosyltransferase [Ancylothrix sp. D3o]MCT7950820.1 glycosyltransferase [Ancylothrix sp. D3o]
MSKKSSIYPLIQPIPEGEKRPFWSVMIPTYNPSEFLAETLESILSQDPGIEEMQIEVVDDCSTQNTAEKIVKEIGKGRVNFYRHPHNLGISGNWTSCIQRAKGYWVHILHQDDRILPGFYSRFRQVIQQQPTLNTAFCRNIYMDELGNWQYLSNLESYQAGFLSEGLNKILVSCAMMCPAVVVRRSVYESLGGFHPDLKYALDWDMWKRISAHNQLWYEPEPLACYRIHPTSTSNRLIRTGENISELFKSIEITQEFLPDFFADELLQQAKEYQAMFAFHLAQGLLANNEIPAAIAQIREALKGCQSAQVLKAFAEVLNKPESSQLLPGLAQLFVNADTEQFLLPPSLPEGIFLKDINLIIFPDWNQPEELLCEELSAVFQQILSHPDKNQIALLVYTGSFPQEDATLILSGIMMNLFMEYNLEETDAPEINLIDDSLSPQQWQVLLPQIKGQIALQNETINKALAAGVPCYQLNNLNNIRFLP